MVTLFFEQVLFRANFHQFNALNSPVHWIKHFICHPGKFSTRIKLDVCLYCMCGRPSICIELQIARTAKRSISLVDCWCRIPTLTNSIMTCFTLAILGWKTYSQGKKKQCRFHIRMYRNCPVSFVVDCTYIWRMHTFMVYASVMEVYDPVRRRCREYSTQFCVLSG